MRLMLLQRGLRRFLLDSRKRGPLLSRFDPALRDYTELDQMVEVLWQATPQPVMPFPAGRDVVQPMPERGASRVRAS